MVALFRHMHNGNPPFHYVMAFSDKGKAFYRKAKTIPAEQAICWTLATILGRVKPGTQFSMAPLCKNDRNESTWAVFDCDDHVAGSANARQIGDRLLTALKQIDPGQPYLYEFSGGGIHLFLFAGALRPCSEWLARLQQVAALAGVTLAPGVCEIRPMREEGPLLGTAMRVPGSFNPKTGTFSEVISHDISNLLDQLISSQAVESALTSFPKREKDLIRFTEESPRRGAELSSENAPIGAELERKENREKTNENRPVAPLTSGLHEVDVIVPIYPDWDKRWSREFGITLHRTRHNQLAAFTGHIFHQLARRVALQLVSRQYAEKTVPTRASASDHEAEFGDLWSRLHGHWLTEFNRAETDAYNKLTTEIERDAFRIIRSWHQLAAARGATDFPVARDNLACRLGITPQHAGQLRQKLTTCSILKLTRPYQPHKLAACYFWTASSGPITAERAAAMIEEDLATETSASEAAIGCDPSPAGIKNETTQQTTAAITLPTTEPFLKPRVEEKPKDRPALCPLDLEIRIYRRLEMSFGRTLDQLEKELGVPAPVLIPTLQRMERALCLHQARNCWEAQCLPELRPTRRALELLFREARARKSVHLDDATLEALGNRYAIPLPKELLIDAFNRAVETGILNSDGTVGPRFDLSRPTWPLHDMSNVNWTR